MQNKPKPNICVGAKFIEGHNRGLKYVFRRLHLARQTYSCGMRSSLKLINLDCFYKIQAYYESFKL